MISSQDGKAVNILEEYNRDVWEAAEGALRIDASVVIDMKCSLKLQEIQLINGGAEFITKGFSVLGSDNSTGPWSRLFMGELEKVTVQVGLSFNDTSNLYYFVFRMEIAQTNKLLVRVVLCKVSP